MRILSLVNRAALRSPCFLSSTARAAIPVLATVQQPLFSSHPALPALVVPIVNQKQPILRLLPLVAAASVLGVLSQSYEPAYCGKRKKKDSDPADDMYEVDHIQARKLEKGAPASEWF